MKTTLYLSLIIASSMLVAAQTTQPELKNVIAAQRAGSFYVDITYDLVAPEGVRAVVIVEASADNGANYNLPVAAITGDFGLVTAGVGKRIVWNAWNDWPGHQTSAARVRLLAEAFTVNAPPQATPRTNLAWIPPGTFTMGSPSTELDRGGGEDPQTQVWISQGFWMGQYEVTQGEYREIMGSNPSYFTGDDRRPVEQVSWDDAVNYCAELTAREQTAGRLPAGYIYRLPTEAEWEYACRAGTTTRFGYGDDPDYTRLPAYAWFGSNSGGRTHPVGEKFPNRWGLFDMHGNVWEWCADWYDSYPGASSTDPKGPLLGSYRVYRGGCWINDGLSCRSALRFHPPSDGDRGLGFRVVLAPGQ